MVRAARAAHSAMAGRHQSGSGDPGSETTMNTTTAASPRHRARTVLLVDGLRFTDQFPNPRSTEAGPSVAVRRRGVTR
jgi:hypothetical protein